MRICVIAALLLALGAVPVHAGSQPRLQDEGPALSVFSDGPYVGAQLADGTVRVVNTNHRDANLGVVAPLGCGLVDVGGAQLLKHLHHPAVGELRLSFNRLDIAADHGLTPFTYAAEPGSRSEQALNLLGSWAATTDVANPTPTTD